MDAAATVAAEVAAEVAERFGRFAREEAPGRSELYAEWAAGVVSDGEVTAILGRIPARHRQPPLVFAVTRLLGAPERSYRDWAEWVREHADDVVTGCTAHSLQTNEPLRCAALLPALSAIDGPVALLEVGASAGLCLYPDRYSYRYLGGPDLDPRDGRSAVILDSKLRGGGPSLRMPEVVWRAGIDLAPLDAADAEDRSFLVSLAWPGEAGRAARIEAALDIAAADPPLLVRGDATERAALQALAALAPSGATLVITTPGVLPHIPREGRDRLIANIADIDAVWVSIDPPDLRFEGVAPIDPAAWGGFVLRRDGRALAAVDPLGAFVEWRDPGARNAR
ncbi:hypothetical protein BH10ACT5_BH10ACT5_05900 [soil metagenome]